MSSQSPRLPVYKIPKEESEGEATLARDLRAMGIHFEREVVLIPGRRWKWDFVVERIAIEIHGATWVQGKHSRGSGQANDFAKANAAAKAGYRTLFYTTETAGSAITDIMEMLQKH